MEEFTCDYDNTTTLACPCEPDAPFCWCKKGYLRDKCGFCVKKKACKKNCYVSQAISCPAGNETLYGCYDASKNRLCPHLRFDSDSTSSYCRSKSSGLITLNVCACLPGYYLNKCDQCMLLRDCKKKCTKTLDQPCSDPNAERVACHKDCETRICKEIVGHKKRKCKSSDKCKENVCVCKPGFALDACDRCVPETQCYSKTPCKCTCPCNMKRREDWRCFDFCYERTCEYLDPRVARRCTLPCRYDCDCAVNFWRYSDENKPHQNRQQKKCIRTRDCPQSWITSDESF